MTTRTRPPTTTMSPPPRRATHPARAATAKTLMYLTLVIAGVAVLLPMSVILFTSLKTAAEATTTDAFTPPTNWLNFSNYVKSFDDGRMLLGFVNTAIILVVSIAGTIIIGSMTAYAIDRFQFRFKKVVIALFLLATLVPGIATQVATFQVINTLGLYNTRWAAIALYMGTDIVSIYIFLQFIRSIPISLDEAARIDGASSWTIYSRIILPNLRPAIATVVIIKGINIYNDFFTPFLYMPSPDLPTISTSLFRFKGPFGAHWENISAGAIIVIVPTLVIFLVLQRFIYNGFTSGSVK